MSGGNEGGGGKGRRTWGGKKEKEEGTVRGLVFQSPFLPSNGHGVLSSSQASPAFSRCLRVVVLCRGPYLVLEAVGVGRGEVHPLVGPGQGHKVARRNGPGGGHGPGEARPFGLAQAAREPALGRRHDAREVHRGHQRIQGRHRRVEGVTDLAFEEGVRPTAFKGRLEAAKKKGRLEKNKKKMFAVLRALTKSVRACARVCVWGGPCGEPVC